jgi:hypothetical protein
VESWLSYLAGEINENKQPSSRLTPKMPLPQLLVGKVAAITGGLTGIGRVRAWPLNWSLVILVKTD